MINFVLHVFFLKKTFSVQLRVVRVPMCSLTGSVPAALLASDVRVSNPSNHNIPPTNKKKHFLSNFCFVVQTMETLDLSFNRLSGTLPDVFGSASRLKELLISNNALSVRRIEKNTESISNFWKTSDCWQCSFFWHARAGRGATFARSIARWRLRRDRSVVQRTSRGSAGWVRLYSVFNHHVS